QSLHNCHPLCLDQKEGDSGFVRASMHKRQSRLRLSLRRRHAAAAHSRLYDWAVAVIIAVVTAVSVSASTARADDAEDRRVRAGARLFRSLLTAQVALESK